MPRIKEKAKVLNGRGAVFTYENDNVGTYWYREKIEGTKKYRLKAVTGATTLLEAIELAPDIAIAMRDDDPHHLSGFKEQNDREPDALEILEREERLVRKQERLNRAEQRAIGRKSITIKHAIQGYLDQQIKRVKANTLEQTSYDHKYHCIVKVQAYLEGYKGISKTHQINDRTFDDYLIFRSDTTRILQHRELSVIGEWIKSFLVRNKYISSDLWLRGSFLPKVEVRMVDRMANPAINADDWRTIVDYVREVWRPKALEGKPYYQYGVLKGKTQPRKKSVWFRTLFWHYILFSKNTGMSPEEVLKLKWKNVEIRDVGRISRSKLEEDLEYARDEGYGDIEGNVEDWLGDIGEWAQSPTQMGREERLVAYITTIRSKTKQPREIPCNQGRELRRWMGYMKQYLEDYEIDYKITPNDYVFMNPFNDFKPVHQHRCRTAWRSVVDKLQEDGKLKGHKFSQHRYTLYSMRSTFIEDHLIKGTDVFLVARLAGHDVKTLMQTYERLDIRKRAEEITNINFGEVKRDINIVNLLDD
tara:strand:- start:193 stop:1785 length:1593 start_codon:yes stop_codon:yes gene_type:complete